MIDVNATIDNMIAVEAQCQTAMDKYNKVFYAIGDAIADGQTLGNIMEPNSYGMLREYMPDFSDIAIAISTYVSNAISVLAIYENQSVAGNEEAVLNACRTLEAINGEFMAQINRFNGIANLINTNAEIAFNRLAETGYLTKQFD